MPVLSSSWVETGPVQADGARPIRETHVYRYSDTDATTAITVDYSAGAGVDPDQVLAARAAKIGADQDMREASVREGMRAGTYLAPGEFWDRFTSAEKQALFAAKVAGPTEAKVLLELAMFELGLRRFVVPSAPETVALLTALASAGLITAQRATEIAGD